jgi:hypothetical protein
MIRHADKHKDGDSGPVKNAPGEGTGPTTAINLEGIPAGYGPSGGVPARIGQLHPAICKAASPQRWTSNTYS